MTRQYHFGLLGYNIGYSLSPLIFEKIFALDHREGIFEVADIPPERLSDGLNNFGRWDGFSVTVPYKEKIAPVMHELSDEARVIAAVNSVRIDGGRFIGYNTDSEGFVYPLRREDFGFKRILILGHGGAARAVLLAVGQEFPKAETVICGRTEKKVEDFIASLHTRYGEKSAIGRKTYDAISDNEQYDLIVNCTPVGSMADSERSPLAASFRYQGRPVCYDLIYLPSTTVFLARAQKAGCRIINGLPMLVRQAVVSYNIWIGLEEKSDALCDTIIESLTSDNEGTDT